MKVCPKCGTQYGDDANFCTADAGRLVAMAVATPAPAASAAPDLLGGRFQLGPRVGGHDTGAVHRGTDTTSGQPVAIKLVAPAVLAQPAIAQRLERELKLLERVQSPHVARVLASGKQGAELWVAMEWIEGAMPLTAQVEAGLVDTERAADLVAAIGAGLLDAAKVGLVHRDLAPKNVLLAGDAVKLVNFAVPSPAERVPGVPGFVSPEVIEGKPIDQRSTTYSLGAVAYFMLTGQAPYVGDADAVYAAHLAGELPPPSAQAVVPASFDAVIARAMDRSPARRYLTLKQFVDDVGKAKGGSLDPARTAPFGRVGKPRESAQVALTGAATDHAKTKVMEVTIPTAALREAETVDDAVVRRAPAPTIQAPAAPPVAATAAAAPVNTVDHGAGLDELATQRSPALIVHEEPIPAPAVVEPVFAPPVEVSAPVEVSTPLVAPAVVEAPPLVVPAVVEAPTPVSVAPTAPVVARPSEPPGSPWAPPPVAAVPEPAPAPVEAAPPRAASEPAPRPRTASAQQPAGGASGKKKQESASRKANKGKFRETLWFKKGELDAAAAEAAAASKDTAVADKADSLPIEERYSDDGTVTSSDADRYSLKTGQTQSMPRYPDKPAADASAVSEDELIGELKRGRRKIFLAIGAAAIVITAIVVIFVA